MENTNRNITDYGNYPMDFTNVDRNDDNQTTLRSPRDIQPGLFSPINQGWNFSSYQNPYGQSYSATPPNSAWANQDPSIPPTHNNLRENSRGYMTSTPMPGQLKDLNDLSVQGDKINSVKWTGFFAKWIISIIIISGCVGVFIQMYPFHEFVCWLKDNCVVIPTTVFILFLLTVIHKLLLRDQTLTNSVRQQESSERYFLPRIDGKTSVSPEKKIQSKDSNIKKKLTFETEQPESKDPSLVDQKLPITGRSEIQVKRTFSGTTNEVWADFLRYYETIAGLNGWNDERKTLVFLTCLRGQAEAYVHGLQQNQVKKWDILLQKMELRFGHSNMKEAYLVEAKLRKRKPGESFRDLGQSIEDLYRRAYPNSSDTVQENSIKTFLDACGESEEFRLAVRRSRPKTLQDAVTSAMEEECIRLSERHKNPVRKNVYSIENSGTERNYRERNSQKYSNQMNSSVNGSSNQGEKRNSRLQYTGSKTKKSKDDVVCYGCGELGHYKSQCKGRQVIGGSPSEKSGGEGTVSALNGDRSEQ